MAKKGRPSWTCSSSRRSKTRPAQPKALHPGTNPFLTGDGTEHGANCHADAAATKPAKCGAAAAMIPGALPLPSTLLH